MESLIQLQRTAAIIPLKNETKDGSHESRNKETDLDSPERQENGKVGGGGENGGGGEQEGTKKLPDPRVGWRGRGSVGLGRAP